MCMPDRRVYYYNGRHSISRIVLGVKRSGRSRPRSLSSNRPVKWIPRECPCTSMCALAYTLRSVGVATYKQAWYKRAIYELLTSLRNDPEPTDSWDKRILPAIATLIIQLWKRVFDMAQTHSNLSRFFFIYCIRVLTLLMLINVIVTTRGARFNLSSEVSRKHGGPVFGKKKKRDRIWYWYRFTTINVYHII